MIITEYTTYIDVTTNAEATISHVKGIDGYSLTFIYEGGIYLGEEVKEHYESEHDARTAIADLFLNISKNGVGNAVRKKYYSRDEGEIENYTRIEFKGEGEREKWTAILYPLGVWRYIVGMVEEIDLCMMALYYDGEEIYKGTENKQQAINYIKGFIKE